MGTLALYVVLVAVWGFGPYAVTVQLGVVAPEMLVAYRFALGAVMLLAFSVALGRSLRFGPREHLFIALQGVPMFGLVDVFFYHAVSHLTGGLVALVVSLLIIHNIFLGALFLRLPIRPRVLLGAIVGLGGMALVFWREIVAFDSGATTGIGFALVASLFGSISAIAAARNQRAGLPVIQTSAIGMVYGAAFTLVLALALGRSFAWDPSFTFLAGFLYMTIPASVVAFVMYVALIGRIGPDRAAYVIVIVPIFALGVSTVLEGHTWTVLSAIGAVLVLAGNFVVLAVARRAVAAVATS